MRKFDIKLIAAGVFGLAGLALAPVGALAGASYDLSIAKSHTGNFTAGQNGTFTITVSESAQSNTGTGSDTVTVTDTLPTGLTYVSSTPGSASWVCNASGQTVTCTATPDMSAGDSEAFTLTVAVASNAPATVRNSVAVSAPGDQTVGGNNAATDDVTINRPASPSPSPSASASPSPSPTPTAIVLPRAGRPGSPAPLGAAGLLAFGALLLGGVLTAARLRR
jgi:uncharacterized repeat protein (TIGR01451 family)